MKNQTKYAVNDQSTKPARFTVNQNAANKMQKQP